MTDPSTLDVKRRMRRVRLQGAGMMLAGTGLVFAGFIGNAIGTDALTAALPAALPPGFALVLVGATMLLSGHNSLPRPGRFDFVDWFENLPWRERLRYFVATGVGFALGFLVTLYLSDWNLLDLL